MKNLDSKSYRKFTSKQEIDKFMNILEGLLKGIAIDNSLIPEEVTAIEQWIEDCGDLIHLHPHSEIVPQLMNVINDSYLKEETKDDILFVCKNFKVENIYFDSITSDMQILQGIISGIVADQKISESELNPLGAWLDERQDLQGCWPYDEIKGLIKGVLQDGKIDKQEHDVLSNFFGDFLSHYGHRVIKSPLLISDGTIQGVCAVNPSIEFTDKKFCFTGESTVAPRSKIALVVKDKYGIFSDNVTRDLNYLIIGANGNQCWAFSCYGRKIEKAIELRKKGQKLVIVHEVDFWKAANQE